MRRGTVPKDLVSTGERARVLPMLAAISPRRQVVHSVTDTAGTCSQWGDQRQWSCPAASAPQEGG